MKIDIGPLEAFYIVGAIVLLIIAIIAYPTMRKKTAARACLSLLAWQVPMVFLL